MQNKNSLKTGTIRQTIFVNASPGEVYDAFMNPRIHSKFTGSKATGSALVGGRITAWDGYVSGKNVKLQKGKLIVQDWRTTDFPKGYGYSRLKLSFKKKGKGTQLTMLHTKIPTANVKEFRSGWFESYWDPLKKYFDAK